MRNNYWSIAHLNPESVGDSVFYEPISPPQADDEALANRGERLLLVHGCRTRPVTRLVVAPRGLVTAGWVIGLIAPGQERA